MGLLLSGVAGLAERSNVSRSAWFYDLSRLPQLALGDREP
jgi:hypothetical protein